jgi:hypothetical protein
MIDETTISVEYYLDREVGVGGTTVGARVWRADGHACRAVMSETFSPPVVDSMLSAAYLVARSTRPRSPM